MIKKLLLIAVAILAVSCSENTEDLANNINTEDGNIIEYGETNAAAIYDFLKKHSGRYYEEYNYHNMFVKNIMLRIEDGKLYQSTNEIQGNKIFSENKFQIETIGNESSTNYYDRNSYIITLNFSDTNIQVFSKKILIKENFHIPASEYKKTITVSEAGKYAGNYYQWESIPSNPQPIKKYFLIIDTNGNIYFPDDNAAEGIGNLEGNTLSLTFSQYYTTYNFIIENNKAIMSSYIDNKEIRQELKKSDLLTPYIGTYSADNITLTVNEDKAVIEGVDYIESILTGNNLIIYEYSNDEIKEHKIVFSEDKQTADYTKANNGNTVTLIRQTE